MSLASSSGSCRTVRWLKYLSIIRAPKPSTLKISSTSRSAYANRPFENRDLGGYLATDGIGREKTRLENHVFDQAGLHCRDDREAIAAGHRRSAGGDGELNFVAGIEGRAGRADAEQAPDRVEDHEGGRRREDHDVRSGQRQGQVRQRSHRGISGIAGEGRGHRSHAILDSLEPTNYAIGDRAIQRGAHIYRSVGSRPASRY